MFPSNLKRLFLFWTKDPEQTPIQLEIHTKVINSIESLALFLRYLTLIIVVVGYIIEAFHQQYLLPLFIVFIVAHNVFVHFTFFFGKYHLFTTPLNFFLHLSSITLAVLVTEKEYSPIVMFYPFFIFSYLLYVEKKPYPLIVTLIVIIFMCFSIIGAWLWEGISYSSYYLFWRSFTIFFSAPFAYFFLFYINETRKDLLQKEQELLYTQGIIKSIIDSIGTPIIIFDEREIIVDANANAYDFFQLKSEGIIGERIRSFFFDDTLIGEHLLSLKSRENMNINAIALTSTGEEIPVDFIVQAFYQNRRRHFLGILIDKREQQRLQEISFVLRKQKEEIENKLNLLKEIQVGLSNHIVSKIYNYLTIIKNILYLATKEQLGSLSERQKNALEIAYRAIDELEREINKEMELVSKGSMEQPYSSTEQ
ncbi:MAG TPA: PAS domain-containing protein [Candidatus Hydrogenedens sp.]|nr:PAS domain-containing protein [Candidatus Hydrogenedens sp.]